MSLSSNADQLIRFVGVGGAASILYFVAATALNAVVGLSATPSSVLAYAIGALFAFFMHRKYTFRSADAAMAEAPKFILATVIGLGLALIIPVLLAQYPPLWAFTAVVIIVPVCSFLMMKFFVFSS